MVSQYRIADTIRPAPPAHNSPEPPVKLTNLTITPKLGILVGVTLFGLCIAGALAGYLMPVSYTHLRAHETRHDLVCRLLLEKKKKINNKKKIIIKKEK